VKASPENGEFSRDSPDATGNPSDYNGYGGSPDNMAPPELEPRDSPNYGGLESKPEPEPEPRDSPNYGGPESPMHERYRSQSPPAEE